ncbi:DICT sensory domain-containing protein [Natrialba swarupiae]|uniref:Histidine kinase n=1 Tax=Natrialba swarupiae TaxID=2448032 RepID=A0A5D5AGU8_9EURY|nr:DICT sensory domain-containing protein [Natrialba swarupiae]TYT61068.1 histidine kinase [Natrialba swarupiae]
MILRSLIDEVGNADHTIAVVGDDTAGPLTPLLADAFDDAGISVETTDDASNTSGAGDGTEFDVDDLAGGELDPTVATGVESDGTTAVLLEEGVPVAASPMMDLYESILAINSDLFATGARGLGEVDLPDVLSGLADSRLRLRGYPLAHREKLLLILISRYIEQEAWQGDSGTIRSAFQQLSRIDDEIGTRRAYRRLAETDVDVHIYGVDDGDRPTVDSATVHAGTGPAYRDSWFVVYRPPDGASTDGAALVSVETEPRVWDGFFTFDPDHVARIDDAISREFGTSADEPERSGHR